MLVPLRSGDLVPRGGPRLCFRQAPVWFGLPGLARGAQSAGPGPEEIAPVHRFPLEWTTDPISLGEYQVRRSIQGGASAITVEASAALDVEARPSLPCSAAPRGARPRRPPTADAPRNCRSSPALAALAG